jgi:membrane-associated phospholipid phosphatase
VNLFLAAVNGALIGRGPRHAVVALAFLAACAVPPLLSVLQDRLGTRGGAAASGAGRRAVGGAAGRVLGFVRAFYVHVFYGPYFAEVILLSQAVWGGWSLDGLVAGLEAAVFGFQPAVAFSEGLRHLRWVNELFFLGYFSYYPIITTGFWVMFTRGHAEAARRAVFIATTSFALLYVWYVLVPVHGPKYFFDALHQAWYGPFEGYLAVPLMKTIFNNMSLAGAAFPSSHVAIGVIAVLLIRRHLRGLYRIYLALLAVLAVSTVYIYAHYAVDVIAGLAVVPLLLWAVRPLYPRARRLTERSGAGSGAASAASSGSGPGTIG